MEEGSSTVLMVLCTAYFFDSLEILVFHPVLSQTSLFSSFTVSIMAKYKLDNERVVLFQDHNVLREEQIYESKEPIVSFGRLKSST